MVVRLQGLTIHDLAEHNGGSTPLHLHCSLSASRQRTRVRCELCQKQRVPFPTISNKEAIIELPSRLQLSNATTASYEDRPMGSERQGRLPQHSVTLPSHVALLPIHRFGRCPPTQTPVQARCSGTHSFTFGLPRSPLRLCPPPYELNQTEPLFTHTAACSPPRIALWQLQRPPYDVESIPLATSLSLSKSFQTFHTRTLIRQVQR